MKGRRGEDGGVKGKNDRNKGKEKKEIGREGRRSRGEAEVALFLFRESNQIPLIAHYLKRLSGAVMRLHAGPRLRDFLVYRCWRVL